LEADAHGQDFHVYILAGKSGVLYTGITNNLARRVCEHKHKQLPGFTQKYNVTNLVWFQAHGGPASAIAREKEIKAWRREKKVALIATKNPQWRDLSDEMQLKATNSENTRRENLLRHAI
jgi:putative endonuclease